MQSIHKKEIDKAIISYTIYASNKNVVKAC